MDILFEMTNWHSLFQNFTTFWTLKHVISILRHLRNYIWAEPLHIQLSSHPMLVFQVFLENFISYRKTQSFMLSVKVLLLMSLCFLNISLNVWEHWLLEALELPHSFGKYGVILWFIKSCTLGGILLSFSSIRLERNSIIFIYRRN